MTKAIERKKSLLSETAKPPLADYVAALETEITNLRQEREALLRNHLIGMALRYMNKFSGLQAITDRLSTVEAMLKDRSDALAGLKIIAADPVLLYQHAREFIGSAKAAEILDAATRKEKQTA